MHSVEHFNTGREQCTVVSLFIRARNLFGLLHKIKAYVGRVSVVEAKNTAILAYRQAQVVSITKNLYSRGFQCKIVKCLAQPA